jgi:hypothetical protein
MSIIVHIERLILDGVSIPHRQRPQVQVALEEELARLIAADGLGIDLRTSGSLSRVNGGEIQFQGDEEPGLLGKRIAQAIYRGIGQ